MQIPPGKNELSDFLRKCIDSKIESCYFDKMASIYLKITPNFPQFESTHRKHFSWTLILLTLLFQIHPFSCKPYGFLMLSGGRERVHWVQMGYVGNSRLLICNVGKKGIVLQTFFLGFSKLESIFSFLSSRL